MYNGHVLLVLRLDLSPGQIHHLSLITSRLEDIYLTFAPFVIFFLCL